MAALARRGSSPWPTCGCKRRAGTARQAADAMRIHARAQTRNYRIRRIQCPRTCRGAQRSLHQPKLRQRTWVSRPWSSNSCVVTRVDPRSEAPLRPPIRPDRFPMVDSDSSHAPCRLHRCSPMLAPRKPECPFARQSRRKPVQTQKRCDEFGSAIHGPKRRLGVWWGAGKALRRGEGANPRCNAILAAMWPGQSTPLLHRQLTRSS